jgi:hypothetical protein
VAAAILRGIESGPPQPDISQGKAEVPMSIVKRHLAESEVRMVLVEEICIDSGALVLDPKTDEVYFSADHDAYKNAFQERELAENQNRPEGEVSRRWIC